MGLFKKQTSTSKELPRRRASGEEGPRPTRSRLVSFRRNRTITGSTSANIASGGELNAELRSPRAHVHHLTNVRRRLSAYLIGAALVCLLLYGLLSQMVADVKVSVADVDILPAADSAAYIETLDSYYAARPTERLRFLLNDDDLLSHMQSRHAEIRRLHLNPTGGFGEASLRISPREPTARWTISGSSRYVDENGIVFSRNYFPSPGLTIVDNSGIESSGTQVVASQRFLGFVGRVIGQSKQRKLRVTTATIPTLTTRQLAISLKGVRQRYILSTDRSAGEQVEDMQRITRYLGSKNIRPTYVDVRVKGKAFYR